MSDTLVHSDPNKSAFIDIDDLFMGDFIPGKKLTVAKVGDWVRDKETGDYQVTAMDPNGLVPTLELWVNPTATEATPSLAYGLSKQSPITHKALIDSSSFPYIVNLSTQTYIYNQDAEKFKVFLGTDTSDSGNVISGHYNQSGSLISTSIDLVTQTEGDVNFKTYGQFKTTVLPVIGSAVTVVLYANDGSVLDEIVFYVRHGANIQGVSEVGPRVGSVELVGSSIDFNDKTVIHNEFNTPFTLGDIQCKINYTDGSTRTIDIDNVNAKLLGLSAFNPDVLGTGGAVTLKYIPLATEHSFGPRSVAKTYKIVNSKNESSLGFKLFCVPKYTGIGTGYELDFYLSDHDHTKMDLVTPHVTVTRNLVDAYSPVAYSYEQALTASINIDDVYPGLSTGITHTQDFSIELNVPDLGATPNSAWIIDYNAQAGIELGAGNRFYFDNVLGNMSINLEMTDLADWLLRLYYPCAPLYDPEIASGPKEPTGFNIVYGPNKQKDYFHISEWRNVLQLTTASEYAAVSTSDTIMIEWLFSSTPLDRSVPDNILGITPVIVMVSA